MWIIGYTSLPSIATDEALYIAASVFLSALYHYMGLQLARAVSATTLLSATNLGKVLIVLYGALALGDTSTVFAWSGLTLAILGNVIYMLARLHVMHAQALQQQAVTDEDLERDGNAADITESISESEIQKGNATLFAGSGEATATWLRDRAGIGPPGGDAPRSLGGPTPALRCGARAGSSAQHASIVDDVADPSSKRLTELRERQSWSSSGTSERAS